MTPKHVEDADLIREAQALGWDRDMEYHLLALASLCKRSDEGDVIAPLILADAAKQATAYIKQHN